MKKVSITELVAAFEWCCETLGRRGARIVSSADRDAVYHIETIGGPLRLHLCFNGTGIYPATIFGKFDDPKKAAATRLFIPGVRLNFMSGKWNFTGPDPRATVETFIRELNPLLPCKK